MGFTIKMRSDVKLSDQLLKNIILHFNIFLERNLIQLVFTPLV